MAARFRFALQPLLDLRVRIEEEKRSGLELVRRRREEALRDREHLGSALILRALQRKDAGSLAVFDAALTARLRRAESAESEMLSARDELIAASRERRALEKLRERRRRAFEEEEARREDLEIDEANARRRLR